MKKRFSIIVEVGGRSRKVKDSAEKIRYSNGKLYGLTEYYGPKKGGITGCKVWIYSRQSEREIADTFFHEMTHVFLQMFAGIKKQGKRDEAMANWIGYMTKTLLADQYGRYDRRKKTR